jgi:hypothetical protein
MSAPKPKPTDRGEVLALVEPLIEWVRQLDHDDGCEGGEECECEDFRAVSDALDYVVDAAIREVER